MSLTTIATYEAPALAHVAKSRLVDEEIPCFIADEHIIGMKLQVPEELAAPARAILKESAPPTEDAGDTFLFFGHPIALAQHRHQCLVCGVCLGSVRTGYELKG